MKDKRPDPKPRKLPRLWQSYLWWDELMEMRKRHNLRISSIEKGKSNLDIQFEQDMIEFVQLETLLKHSRKEMIKYGNDAGPIWEWATSMHGLKAGGEVAKLLAQIDDIGKFATISKLWAFAGWAVRDGQIDRREKGIKSPYNSKLKAICFIIVDLFIKHHTPVYRDYYDEQYRRDRRIHPVAICTKCGGEGEQRGLKWYCSQCGQSAKGRGLQYTPAHMNARARRKTAKLFLSHVWVKWREYEGLSVSEPYVQAILGHTHIVEPSS